jgi:hypothetical protein
MASLPIRTAIVPGLTLPFKPAGGGAHERAHNGVPATGAGICQQDRNPLVANPIRRALLVVWGG